MAASWTSLATIVQRVLRLGCWGRGGILWSALQHRSAGRLGLASSQTCSSGTWTSLTSLDNRRLEVVADGLTLWRGAQLAVDTTLVSLCRDAQPGEEQLTTTGQHWKQLARGRKTPILNSLGKVAGRGLWCWRQKSEGGGAARQLSSCVPSPKLERRARLWSSREGWSRLGCYGGAQSSPAALQDRLLSLCWTVARHQGRCTLSTRSSEG